MKRIPAHDALAEAAPIINVWTANPEFQMGDITLAKFKTALDSLKEAQAAVESKRAELAALIMERANHAIEVSTLVTRARSGIRAVYGPNSHQYGQAGGTRTSERKRPVPKDNPDLKHAA